MALQNKLELASQYHRTGRLEEAEQLYRQVLRKLPRKDDLLHVLGLLRHQRGDAAEAARLISEAVKIRPGVAVYYENLAVVQRTQGNLAAVVETCRRGLARGESARLRNELIDALIGTGRFGEALAELDRPAASGTAGDARLADRALCLLNTGDTGSAETLAGQALQLKPDDPNALSVLAEAASRTGRHAVAVERWRAAVAARPDWVAARVNLALAQLHDGDPQAALQTFDAIGSADANLIVAVLGGKAAAHRRLGEVAASARLLRHVLALDPGATMSWSNLSDLQRSEAPLRALRAADRALACSADAAAAHSNRGLALNELDRIDEAIAAVRRAVALDPADATFTNNLAHPMRWSGVLADAMSLYRRALAIDPGHAAAAHGLGTAHLKLGDLGRGWAGYENRFTGVPDYASRPFTLPRWQGERPEGRLLVWGEQGLGDEITFGSMLPDLARRQIPALVECDRRLVEIFARSMPELAFVARTNPPDARLAAPDIVAQAAMGSLAPFLRAEHCDFPDSGGYLKPRADLVATWRRRLDELGPGLKVGFAWRSSRSDPLTARFHPPIAEWSRVIAQPGTRFVSLQYGGYAEERRSVETLSGRPVHDFADLDLMNDLENVLALSAAVDLVISTGTTAYCLPAGAGTPTWVLFSDVDFVNLGTDRCPWFPSVRAYSRDHRQPWSSVIGRIVTDLADLVGKA